MRRAVRSSAVLVPLCFALAACGGVRDRVRALPAPASTAFDAAELVDVLEPDRIPSIDHPKVESPADAAKWLKADEPVVVVEIAGEARAYPLAILTWHEIVNDSLGGRAVGVVYDPLADAALVFDRAVAGRVESFGVSGKLYRSGLVMFDRRTKSLWPLLAGRAVQGPLAGSTLARVPPQISSLGEFAAAYPKGQILSRDTGNTRSYGFNPYAGYDSRTVPAEDFIAVRADPRLAPMARIVGATVGTESRAYPFARLSGGVANDRLGGRDVVVLWRPGTRSALDAPTMAAGRDIGSAGVFSPVLAGRHLDLAPQGSGFRDRQTGSTWSVLGVATAGSLAGKHLGRIQQVEAFWFAWAAFVPTTSVWDGR